MLFNKCKITVKKRYLNEEIVNTYLKDPAWMKICDLVQDNQEFIVENPFEMPKGICASAWADIRPHIITMASGGKFKFMKNTNVGIAICSDPFRPVVFEIERIS